MRHAVRCISIPFRGSGNCCRRLMPVSGFVGASLKAIAALRTSSRIILVPTSVARRFVHQLASGSPSELWPIIAISSFGLFLSWPVLVYGFWPFSGDAQLHINWYTHFSRQFWAAEVYPRWLTGMNHNLGSPVFFYYPPLPYFMTSLFRPFVIDDAQGWRQLALSASCALIGSGLSSYAWLKRTVQRRMSALMAAMLFMLMPYHLRTDLYVRGAFAEFWTFVWIRLILLAVQAVSRGRPFATLGLSVSYAFLITTHLRITLIFSLVPICYAWWRAVSDRRPGILLRTIAGMSLGVGLASIYLLPAMLMQKYVSTEFLLRGFYYAHSFISLSPHPFSIIDDFNMQISWLVVATAGAGICGFAIALSNRSAEIRREAGFWSFVGTGSVFMMLPLSNPIWTVSRVLQTIQFPWRFTVILSVAVAALLALGFDSFNRKANGATILAAGLLCAFVAIWIHLSWLDLWRTPILGRINYSEYSPRTDDAPEWRPKWVHKEPEQIAQELALTDAMLPDRRSLDSSGRQDVKYSTSRNIRLSLHNSSDATLLIRQFYFPGWTAQLD